MTIARSAGVFLGTDETTLLSVAAGVTTVGAEVDVLASDAAAGEIELFAVVTFGAVAGVAGVNLKVNKRRVTGQVYTLQNFVQSIAAVASTPVKVPLGRMSASRYMNVVVQNTDATNAVSVTVGYELTKFT